MKPLVLGRQVELEKYEVLMEIGRQQPREELHAVLLLAEEHGGQATATDIANELLLGRPESVGKAVLDRCRDLDLLDEFGRITRIGREALQAGNVFIPERARYLMWYTEDPLIPQRLLNLEPRDEPDLRQEVAVMKSRQANDSKNESVQNLPDRLRSLEGRSFSLMGRGEGTVTVRSIDMKGLTSRADPSDRVSITLRIEPSGSNLTVGGRFDRVLPPPSLTFEEAWFSALGPLAKLWARSRNPPALRVIFEELSDRELMSFSKTVILAKPSLRNYGDFDETSVEDVPIFPQGRVDATKWAKWLLKESVNTYMTDEKYQRLVDACVSRFPDFPNIELPSSKELARELSTEKTNEGRLPKKYWYIQAPLDLQMVDS